MDYFGSLILGGISFGRNIIGLVSRPYETYRRLVERGNLWELPFLGLLLVFYFTLASVVKTAAFRPFLLTRGFLLLSLGTAGGFLVVVGSLWLVGRRLGGQGNLKSLALAWSYTLLPTLFWFLATSILYVILPPPRTSRPQGIVYSLIYLTFSAILLFWKATLAYLTLRFGLKLDLWRILAVAAVTVVILSFYSILMYRLGIFKVPFL